MGRSADTSPDRSLWPAEVRFLISACVAMGVQWRAITDDGYLVELAHGDRQLALAAGRACIYPTNSAAAVAITRDKMHTTHLLEAHGLASFGGQLFFLTDYHRRFRAPGREREDAVRYAEEIGFPLFAKPNVGARGDFAEIIPDLDRLEDYLDEVAGRYDCVLLQTLFAGSEYRVLCIDDEALVAVERLGPRLVGDGSTTLRAHLEGYNSALAGTGVSAIAEGSFGEIARQVGRPLDEVVAAGEAIVLPGRRNLAISGQAERLLQPVPDALARLALSAAGVCGLAVAGVDLMDTSAHGDLSELKVVEVNGAPGLAALEQHARLDLIHDIWRRTLSRAFGVDLALPV